MHPNKPSLSRELIKKKVLPFIIQETKGQTGSLVITDSKGKSTKFQVPAYQLAELEFTIKEVYKEQAQLINSGFTYYKKEIGAFLKEYYNIRPQLSGFIEWMIKYRRVNRFNLKIEKVEDNENYIKADFEFDFTPLQKLNKESLKSDLINYCKYVREEYKKMVDTSTDTNQEGLVPMSNTIEEIEIKSYTNPWIRFEDIPDDSAKFLEYKAKIVNEITFKSSIMPDGYDKIDRLRLGWHWEKFIGTATKTALYELHNQSFTNVQNIKAWINGIETFIREAEASNYETRKRAQKEEECPSDAIAYLKIVLDVYSKRQEAPYLGQERAVKVFADCFIVLPFLKWKLNQIESPKVATLTKNQKSSKDPYNAKVKATFFVWAINDFDEKVFDPYQYKNNDEKFKAYSKALNDNFSLTVAAGTLENSWGKELNGREKKQVVKLLKEYKLNSLAVKFSLE